MVSVNAIQGTLIADNAITAVHIATNAVSGTLIADNAVTATHIAQNTITVTQLADDAVEADKIADGVITTNHLNKAMISSQTEVTPVAGDFVLIGDTSDSNNLKKTPISGITALATVSGISSSADATAITIDSSERVLIGASGGISYAHGDADDVVIYQSDGNVGMTIASATDHSGNIWFSDGTSGADQYRGWVIYNHGENRLSFGSNGSERMRIDSSGRLLVGHNTSIANASLDDLQVGSGSGNTGMTIYSGTSSYGGIAFADGNTGASDQYPGLIEYYHNDNSMRFYTGSSERIRIDEDNSTGVVGINTTNLAQSNHLIVQGGTSEQLGKIRVRSQVAAGSTAPGGQIEFAGHHAGTSDGTRIFSRIIGKKENNTGGAVGGRIEMYVNSSGGSLTEALKIEDSGTVYVTGGSVSNISSDARVKDDVQDLTDGLNILKQLKPKTFKYNTKYSAYFPHHATETQYGFIADEVKTVAPQYTETKIGMIDGTEVDDMKTLSMTKMIPMLVKAIQELEARVKELEG